MHLRLRPGHLNGADQFLHIKSVDGFDWTFGSWRSFKIDRKLGAALTSHTLLISGHKRSKLSVQEELSGAGFELVLLKPGEDHWGFPSYTDPLTAEAFGHPNAGHTPGTAHPFALEHLVLDGDHEKGCTLSEATGKPVKCEHVGQTEERHHDCKHVGDPYEPDPRIAFVTVSHADPRSIDHAQDIASKFAWSLRTYWETPAPPKENELMVYLAKMQVQIDELTAKLKGAI